MTRWAAGFYLSLQKQAASSLLWDCAGKSTWTYLFIVVNVFIVILSFPRATPEENRALRFSSRSLGWKDAALPFRLLHMWSCCIDYSLHLLCVCSVFFSPFYCELLSLLCVIFPIHTQPISMSHSKCSLLRSRPKVFSQTDSLFMVFSSINGLLSQSDSAALRAAALWF